MKKIYFTILSLLITSSVYLQENKIEALLRDFQSTDWPTVLSAKEKLENLEVQSIPQLMQFIRDNSDKKLVNTGDLIYPGAEKFFGHGQIIDYDIDKIDIRAGWLLEDITFQNFGFSGIHIEPSSLNDFIKIKFPDYYNNSKNSELIKTSDEAQKRELIKKLSIQEAENWWKMESEKWSRFDALVSSLKSEDERRQVKGLFYLRNGKSACMGLDRDSYKKNIEPLIENLSKSRIKRVSEQAKLILVDVNFEWLEMKLSQR